MAWTPPAPIEQKQEWTPPPAQEWSPPAPQASPEAPQTAPQESQGIIGTLGDIATQAVTGAVQAASEFIDTTGVMASWLDKNVANLGTLNGGDFNQEAQHQALQSFEASMPQAKTTAGAITHGLSQFVAPFGVVGKGLKAAGMANGLIRGMTAGAIADFSAFDAHQERLSNWLAEQDNPVLSNSVTKYLASSKEDSELEGKLKNMVEGLGFGVVADTIIHGIKLVKAGIIAKKNASTIEKMKPAFNEARDRLVETGINPEEATRRAMDMTGLRKTDFVPETGPKLNTETMSQGETIKQAKEMGISPEAYVKKGPSLVTMSSKSYDLPAMKAEINKQYERYAASLTERTDKVGKMVENHLANYRSPGTKGYLTSLPAKLVLGVRETAQAINPRIGHVLNKWEMANHDRLHTNMLDVDQFEKAYKGLSKRDRATLDDLWNKKDGTAVRAFADSRPALKQAMSGIDAMLKRTVDEGKPLGAFDDAQLIHNYLPTNIRDFEGYLKATGREEAGSIDNALAEARDKAGRDLTPYEKADVINKAVRNRPIRAAQVGKASHMKERTMEVTPPHLRGFYDKPVDALRHYVSTMSENIGRRKLLGYTEKGDGLNSAEQLAKTIREGGSEGGIGIALQEEKAAGNINSGDMHNLSSLIQSRLGPGTLNSARKIQMSKNFMYMGTLANPFSALKQVGDVLLGSYVNGLSNSVMGLAKTLLGRGPTKEDMGLREINQDLSGHGLKSHIWLNKALSLSGFSKIDAVGKNSILNGSLIKYKRLAKTVKGEAKIRNQYRSAFTPEEMDQVINDLRAGNISNPNVKYMLWNDLTDMQPISLSEMPKAYLDNPNGRFFYALKTFTLKGLNRLYFDGIDQWRRGNLTKGTRNLMTYATLLAASGMPADMINDKIMGKDQMDIPDRFLSGLLGIMSMNDYTIEMLKRGDLEGAVTSTILPPVAPLATSLYKDVAPSVFGDKELKDVEQWKSMNYVPFVGRAIYNIAGGGAERYNDRLDKKGLREQIFGQ